MSSTPLSSWIAEARAWLQAAAAVWLDIAREAPRLEEALAQMAERAERLEAPLVIVLTGGTGAGKSTLLNALAGRPIARTGARRPTTTELTIYHHREAALLLPPALARLGTLVEHDRAPLRDKVLVDAPDFDSTHAANRERLAAALGCADMALVVASPEKYVNADLFALLATLRRTCALAFVLTHRDLLDDEAAKHIEADLSAELERAGITASRLFALSASLAARARALGQPLPPQAGAFAALERWIEHELNRTRIRRLKEANLLRMADNWLARAEAALPSARATQFTGVRARAEQIASESALAIARRWSAPLERDDALLHALEQLHASAIGGPTGLYLALTHALRHLWRPPAMLLAGLRGASPRPDVAESPRFAPDPEDEETLESAHARIAALAADKGLRLERSPKPEGEQTPPSFASPPLEHAATAATRASLAIVEQAGARSAPLVSLAANLAPLGVLGFGLWRWFEVACYGRGTLAPDWIEVMLLFALIATVLSARLARRWARRRARRTRERLVTAARRAVDAALHPSLLAPLQRTLERAGHSRGALTRLRTTLAPFEEPGSD